MEISGCKQSYVIQWLTQVGKITTNLKVKIDVTLPEFSAMKIAMWNFHVDDSAKVRYYMILGRNLDRIQDSLRNKSSV